MAIDVVTSGIHSAPIRNGRATVSLGGITQSRSIDSLESVNLISNQNRLNSRFDDLYYYKGGDIDILSNLLFHLKLDGNTNDSTPLENNFNENNSPTYHDGLVSKGILFERDSSQYISRNTLITDNFTFSCWVKPASVPDVADVYGIIGKNNNVSIFYEPVFRLDYSDGGSGPFISFNVALSGKDVAMSEVVTLSTNNWTHLAISYNDTTKEGVLYRNGVQVASDTDGNGSIATDGGTLRIGAGNSETADNFWNGLMDECRYYNRVLTSDEIQFIHSLNK